MTLLFPAALLPVGAPVGAAGPAPAKTIRASPGGLMVRVPAGWFLMGSKQGNDNEFPERRVYLDAFHIDRDPVTNGRYRGPKTQSYGPPDNRPDHPVTGITWFQARRYCRSLGKRLPTEAEWEKAARRTGGNRYPWGARWDGPKLVWARNSGERTHPIGRSALNHTSPFGARDMVGNVMEWVSDWYQKDYYAKAPNRNPKGAAAGKMRSLRGGSWYNDNPWDLDAADRQRLPPVFGDDDIGFRCARDAK